MSDMKAQFEQAVAAARQLTAKPGNATLLAIYALYKQATRGDVTGERPGSFDLVGTAKYDAWEARQGTSRQDAMAAYIALIAGLKG